MYNSFLFLLKNKSSTFGVLLYFFVYLAVFFNYFFVDGMPAGEDWSFPVYGYQLKNWLLGSFYTWGDASNMLGANISFSTSLFLQTMGVVLNKIIGIDGEGYQKILFMTSFMLGGVSAFFLFLRLGINKTAAFVGGIVFTLNPASFNFIAMGWNLALLSIFSLPAMLILFDKYLEFKKIKYLVLIGICFSLIGFLESQSIIHFPIFLSVYYFLKKGISIASFRGYIVSLLLILAIAVGLHIYWVMPIFFIKDPYISSKVVLNDISRFAIRFSYQDIIRGWGSVFNYQFEYAFPKFAYLFSFLAPLSLILLMLLKKSKKYGYFFVFLFFYPFFMYLFLQKLSNLIPYTNVIRDYGRTFPYLFLAAGYFIAQLCRDLSFRKKYHYLLIFAVGMSIIPFINGSLYNTEKKRATGISTYDIDQRLRMYKHNEDIKKIDMELGKHRFFTKGIGFPMFSAYIIPENKKFDGMWASMTDSAMIFSSNIKYQLHRGNSLETLFNQHDNIFSSSNCGKANLDSFLRGVIDSNYFYLILKKDIVSSSYNLSSDKFEECLLTSDKVFLINEYEEYKLFKINHDFFLPHFYIPQKSFISKRSIEYLPRILSQDDWKTRVAVFLEEQNEGKEGILTQISGDGEKDFSIIEFKKINPIKYILRLHSVSGSFPLVFSESFHDGWKTYTKQVESKKLSSYKVNLNNYKILDGNVEDQASKDELDDFIQKGWVTDLGDGKEKSINHQKWENNKEKLDYVEKYNVDFVSKNFQGTIQNDNLPAGHFWDTWFQEPIENNENHLMANGYANSWVIDTDKICEETPEKCIKNADGTYDMEMVVEFWPQRLFYVGVGISGITLLCCVGYLGFDFYRRKNSKRQAPIIKSN